MVVSRIMTRDEGALLRLPRIVQGPVARLLPAMLVLAAFFFSLQMTSRSLTLQNLHIAAHNNDVPLRTGGRHHSMSDKVSVATNEDNETSRRAIFIISMGQEAGKTKLVERFVYSARTLGNFSGFIVLLTDAPAGRYKRNLNGTQIGNNSDHQDKLIVMKPLAAHYRSDFKRTDMVFKRFKTYILHYVAMDPRLKNVQLVYYLDIDIIVAKPLSDFFHGVEQRYQIGSRVGEDKKSTADAAITSAVWMFEGNAKRVQVQSGQIILDVNRSAGCLERWRRLIDNRRETRKDQFPLMQMWKEQQRAKKKNVATPCRIVRMEQARFISFPNSVEVDRRVSEILSESEANAMHDKATLIHIKNTGSAGTGVNETFHQVFVRDILQFPTDKEDTLGITGRMHIEARKSDMAGIGSEA